MTKNGDNKRSEGSDPTQANPADYLADLPSTLISSTLGFMGFSTACIFGLLSGNSGLVIVTRAMVAMVVCAFIGRLLGAVGEICVREYIELYKNDHPEPVKPEELLTLDREQQMNESLVNSMKKAA